MFFPKFSSRILPVSAIRIPAAALQILAVTLFCLAATPTAWSQESPAQAPEPPLEITYLGNEGFLLEVAERKVLVDALVTRAMPIYVQQSEELRGRLERAEGAFAEVDLVLATHRHGDHFDAKAVMAHLRANPRAVFVSTRQAVDRLKLLPRFSELADRVHMAEPVPGDRVRMPDLGLEVLALHHGLDRDPPIQNLGFLIHLEGWKVLHVGDTEIKVSEIAVERLDQDAIDVAMIPSWQLLGGASQGIVPEAIRPRELVVMHLPTVWTRPTQDRVRGIESAFPNAVIFEKPLESRQLSRP